MPRKTKDLTKRKLRSAISNGRLFMRHVDSRGPWVRRLRDLIEDMTEDLGGADRLSTAQRSLIRRCATIQTYLELIEQDMAENDGEISRDKMNQYSTLTNTLTRTLTVLGIERKPRDVTPDPLDYGRGRFNGADVVDAEVIDD